MMDLPCDINVSIIWTLLIVYIYIVTPQNLVKCISMGITQEWSLSQDTIV